MRLATSRARNIANDGGVWLGIGSGPMAAVTLPPYVVGLSRKPCFVDFKKRKFILGQFSRPLILLEDRHVYDAGIPPPQTPATLAAGAAGGTTGTCVGVTWFRQKIGNIIIHDSDPGPETNAVTLTAQGRAWSNIPTDAVSRVTHVVGGYSFEGDELRETWERPIGVTDVTEDVNPLARGDLAPNSHELLVPPYTGFGHRWHARMWYVGLDYTHPYRAWYSEVNKPETIEGHIDTLGYEPITGVFAKDDVLLLFCRRTKYQVRGYTLDDFKIDQLPGFGCISHASIAKDYANRVWWAAEEGIVVNDEYWLADLRTYWRDDLEANPDAFNDCWAIHDRKFSVYKLCTPRTGATANPGQPVVKSFYYVASYFPDVAPALSFDLRSREDTAAGYDEDGNVVTASCDGIIRRENVEDDGDDDGDDYQKRFILRTGHLNMGRPGGNEKEGKNLVRLWDYIRSELDPYFLYVIGGDEDCWEQLSNDAPISPFAVIELDGWNVRHWLRIPVDETLLDGFTPEDVGLDNWLFDMLAQCVHDHGTIDKVSGRGFVIQVDAFAPRRLRYSGFGGLWEKGETFRGAKRERSI